jgi:TolB-like protein
LPSGQTMNTNMPPRVRLLGLSALLAVALGLAGAAFWFAGSRPAIVVAHIQNDTGRPELDPFAKGLSDALLADLGTLDTARVEIVSGVRDLQTPRTFGDLRQIRESTGAGFALVGRLETTGTGLRLSANLIRLNDGQHVWVTQINRAADIDGLADLQQQLLRETLRAVREHVLKDEQPG